MEHLADPMKCVRVDFVRVEVEPKWVLARPILLPGKFARAVMIVSAGYLVHLKMGVRRNQFAVPMGEHCQFVFIIFAWAPLN